MFTIQNPRSDRTKTLHELLLKEVNVSTNGGGAYAFVSISGVVLLFQDEFFKNFLSNHTYTLIVGIDSITSEKAVEKLKEIKKNYKNLKVVAYLNPNTKQLFHPKFSWFENETGGKVIVGSGNLTVGGMRKNTEAILTAELSAKEFNDIKTQWNNWMVEIKDYLKDIECQEVLDKVKENDMRFTNSNGLTNQMDVEEKLSSNKIEHEDDLLWDSNEITDADVLIAEVPKSSKRWSQVNFDKNSFENYFGAYAGRNDGYRILLKSTDLQGRLAKDIESRKAVSVKSSNYRFEINKAKVLGDYPENGRPILVFLKVGIRMYKYFLSMPDDQIHKKLDDYLNNNLAKTNKKSVLRRHITSYKKIKTDIPLLPF